HFSNARRTSGLLTSSNRYQSSPEKRSALRPRLSPCEKGHEPWRDLLPNHQASTRSEQLQSSSNIKIPSLTACHVERSRDIPMRNLTVFPRGSSTPLRSARNDIVYLRSNRPAVSEKFALLDQVGDLRRNHLFPSAVSAPQFRQHVGWLNSQILGMIFSDLLDVLIVDQILKQRANVRSDFDLRCGYDLSCRVVDHWIDVKFLSAFKHSAKG